MGKFCNTISSRLQFVKEIYVWGWRWVVFIVWGLPYAGANLYDFLRGEWFLSWHVLGELLPNWLPPAWFIAGLIAFLLVTIEGAYRISRKARKEQNRTTLAIIGGIENDIFTGKKLLEKLKHSKGLDKYLKKEYDNWYNLVGEFMQRDQYPEFFAWFNAAYTESSATLDDIIKSCEGGVKQLLDIHSRLTNSLTPRKGDFRPE